MFKRIKAWNDRRKSIRELNALDDEMLKDIGISRGEIYWIITGIKS